MNMKRMSYMGCSMEEDIEYKVNEFVIFWKESVAFPGSFVYNVQPGGVIPTCAEAIPLGTEKRKFW